MLLCLYFQIISNLYSKAFCNILSGDVSLMQDHNLTTLTLHLHVALHILSSSSPLVNRARTFWTSCRSWEKMHVKFHRTHTDNKEMSINSNQGIVRARGHVSSFPKEGPELLCAVSRCIKIHQEYASLLTNTECAVSRCTKIHREYASLVTNIDPHTFFKKGSGPGLCIKTMHTAILLISKRFNKSLHVLKVKKLTKSKSNITG